MDDLEYPEIQALLSRPADAIPGQVARRRFLQGALAARGASPCCRRGWTTWPRRPRPSAPRTACSSCSSSAAATTAEHGRPRCPGTPTTPATARSAGSLAVSGALPLADGLGLNPGLTEAQGPLRRRQGRRSSAASGQTADDLSHFSSTATWMAGTHRQRPRHGVARPLARRRPESGRRPARRHRSGPRCRCTCSAGPRVVTALETGGDLFGADRSEPWMKPVYDAVRAMGARHDRTGAAGRPDRRHRRVGHRRWPGACRAALQPGPARRLGWCRTLTLAARLINARPRRAGDRLLASAASTCTTATATATRSARRARRRHRRLLRHARASTFPSRVALDDLLRVRPDRPGQRLRRHGPRHRLGAAGHRRERQGRPLRRPAAGSTT